MKRIFPKILSMLLAVNMLISLIQIPAFSAETETMPKEVSEPQGYAVDTIEPYIIYDAETASNPIDRIYDKYYDTKRTIVEIDGKKGVPWGPKAAGSLKAEKIPDTVTNKASILDQWENYGDFINRPNAISVIDSKGTRKIPMQNYQYLVVEMYSAVNTNQPFLWRLYSDNPDTPSSDFYKAGFNINWEGEWKQIKIAIAGGLDDCGEFTTGYSPLGKPYEAKSIYLLANTAASSNFYPDTEVYIGKIYLEGKREEQIVANDKGEIILPDYYDSSAMTDYVSMLKTKHPDRHHPRILVTEEKLNIILDNINRTDGDPFVKKAYAAVKKKADKLLDEATSAATHTKNGATAFSRKVEDVARKCGFMYLLTGDEKYAERVWKEAKVMIDMEGAPGLFWYNTSTGLDAQHISNGMALLYDWCYDYLNDDQKLAIRNALMKNAFDYASRIRGGGGYMGFKNNVVAANSKGFVTAALAICDEPGYEDFCNEYINNVVTYLPPNLQHQFMPDGNYGEGIGYWTYTIYSLMYMTDAMLTSLGTDGGLQDMPGLKETGYFPFALRGGNYQYNYFNYSDAGKNVHQNMSPVYHYLAERYDIPSLRGYRLELTERYTDENLPTLDILQIEDLLWYNTDLPYDTNWSSDLPKDYFLDGLAPIVSMRSGYGKVTDLGYDSFIAAKGGNSKVGHVQYDAGTFVLDALGKRWVHDLGADVYGGASPEYYYYRDRTEGHNCIVFDPERGWAKGSGQTVAKNHYDTKCPIVDSGASEDEAFSIIDLQPSYTETVEEYKRGYALVNDRSQFIVQDEFTTKEPFELYSYIHTDKTTVVVNSDGRSLTLESYNPKAYCRVDFITNIEDFEIGVMEAVHHPASPQADSSITDTSIKGYSNATMHKIYFRADNVKNATITMVFTPIQAGKSVALPEIKPLADWNEYVENDSYARYSDIFINSINGDSVNITTNGSVAGRKKLILASYKGKRLVNVKIASVSFARNTNDYTVTGFDPGIHDTIKAFVWDDVSSTLKPLSPSK